MCVGVGVYVDEWRILVNTQRGGRCESASDASRGRVVGEHVCSLEGGGVSLVCTAPERPSEDTDKIGTRSHARKHARTCTNIHAQAPRNDIFTGCNSFKTRRHKHGYTHTHAHTPHACTHTRTHTHACTHSLCVSLSLSLAQTHTHTHTHAHMHTPCHTRTHTHTHEHSERPSL